MESVFRLLLLTGAPKELTLCRPFGTTLLDIRKWRRSWKVQLTTAVCHLHVLEPVTCSRTRALEGLAGQLAEKPG